MTPPASAGSGYLAIARRRWPVLLGAVVIGVIVAALAGDLTSASYTAESRVALRAIVADPFQPAVQPSESIDLETERELVGSSAVVEQAAGSLGEDTPDLDDLTTDLEVSIVGESQVLSIQYTAPTAAEAQRWAAAITDAYLDRRQQLADELIASLVSSLDAQIGEVVDSIPPDEEADLRTSDRLQELGRQRSSFLALPTDPGEVIRPAGLPDEESSTPSWVGQVGALGLSVLIGCGVAVAIDRSDNRTRSVAEVAEVAGPLLGDMNLATGAGRRWYGRASRQNGSISAEAARLVNLRLVRTSTQPLEWVVVTSPRSGSAAAQVGTRIAADLAGDGTQVVVIAAGLTDSDDDRPTLDDVAGGRASIDEGLQQAGPDQPDLWLFEVGPDGWDAGSAEAINLLRRDLRSRFSAVVMIAPPVLEQAASSLEVAVGSDAVLLVVAAHGTNLDDLTMAVDALNGVGANFAGTVVARFERA